MIFKPLSLLSGMAYAFLLASCLGGGGTDIGNPNFDSAKVSGTLLKKDGEPSVRASVRIRPDTFLPSSVFPGGGDSLSRQDDSTDTQGYFHFESVRKGKYILEAGDGKGHAVRVPFTVSGESGFLSLPVSQLDTTGSIEGIITYPGGPGRLKIMVSTYGLEHATVAIESGRFVLEGLPSGKYDLHVTTFADSFPPLDVKDINLVAPGRSVVDTIRLGR